MNKGPYYITTAIAYTSGKPHIGNCYEIILADAIAYAVKNYNPRVIIDAATLTGAAVRAISTFGIAAMELYSG